MTFREAAEIYGVTKQAIHQRLSKEAANNRCSMDRYRDKETALLTEQGQAVLAAHYASRPQQKAATAPAPAQVGDQTPAAETNELDALRISCAELRARVEEQQKQLDQLQQDKAFLQQALSHAQHLQAMAYQLLPRATTPAPAQEQAQEPTPVAAAAPTAAPVPQNTPATAATTEPAPTAAPHRRSVWDRITGKNR